MACIFASLPWLIYPDPVVNVKPFSNNTVSFQLRCDDLNLLNNIILERCGGNIIVSPNCVQSYFRQVYTLVVLKCPTNYVTETYSGLIVDTNKNKIVSTFVVLVLLTISFAVLYIVSCWCYCKKHKKYHNLPEEEESEADPEVY